MTAEDLWYRRHPLAWLLLPLTALFCLLAGLRRLCYRFGACRVERLAVPVVVVGNISVGGTGKTPLVAGLARALAGAGLRVGIVTRGYGGEGTAAPLEVTPDSDPRQAGDEAVLLARRAGCPVMAGRDRPAAGRALLERHALDLLLSDDGLQHYRLHRDFEVAVVDGERRFGNGWCLPAGPLRETPRRLKRVDCVVANGAARAGELGMELRPAGLFRVLDDAAAACPPAGSEVHAVAGIGNPGRFFASLSALGLRPTEHPFPDHHRFRPADLEFGDDRPVLMTEKDAVKCRPFADARHHYLAVAAEPPEALVYRLLELFKRNDE